MSRAETLLARATARGGSYEACIAGSVVEFTAADVGHAIAGRRQGGGEFEPLPDGAVRILLRKYAAGDEKDVAALCRDLFEDGDRPRDWADYAAHALFCRVAVSEFLDARRCPVCDGRRWASVGHVVEQCAECRGSGRKPWTGATRARQVGLPYEVFRRGRAENYYLGRLQRLHEWEDQGLRRVVGKLRDGEAPLLVPRNLRAHLEKIAAGDWPAVRVEVFEALRDLPGMRGRLRFLQDADRPIGFVVPHGTGTGAEAAARALLDSDTET